MNKCQNPLCQKPIPSHRKFCPGCKNVVNVRKSRERRKGTPNDRVFQVLRSRGTKNSRHTVGGPAKQTAITQQPASVERLKSRRLFVQEKVLNGAAQAPPASSPDFLAAMAEQNEREAEDRQIVEQKALLLLRCDWTIRNLRAIYLHGTTFELAYCTNTRKRLHIFDTKPGMYLWDWPEVDEYSNGYFGENLDTLSSHEKSELEYARAFLEGRKELNGVICEHGKSWRVECDACKLGDTFGVVTNWNQERANRALCELGLSVWEGKNDMISWGLGGGGGILDAGEDNRDHRVRDRETGRTINAPDSFEKRGEEAEVPFLQGQAYSQPDPNYAADLAKADDPNRQQQDAKQNFNGPDDFARLAALENCEEHIWNKAHERIKDSSSEKQVERIVAEAERELDEDHGEKLDAIDGDEEAAKETT